MIIGNLSEAELIKLSELLDQAGVSYEMGEHDQENSIENLSQVGRMRQGHRISHNLFLDVDDEALMTIADEHKASLFEFGVTSEVPEGLVLDIQMDEQEGVFQRSPIKDDPFEKTKRIIAFTFLILMALYYLEKKNVINIRF